MKIATIITRTAVVYMFVKHHTSVKVVKRIVKRMYPKVKVVSVCLQ